MSNNCFVFEELPSCFPERLPFSFLAMCEGYKVSHILADCGYCPLFSTGYSHPTECEVAFYCDFDLHFPS